MLQNKSKVHIICGPTASGKTDYAFNLAKENSGIIINADSRQLFQGLKIISASPDDYMKNEIPHYLYNFLKNHESYNVSDYINDVSKILDSVGSENIYIVGGTGMYIDALINGLADIPDIPEDFRYSIRIHHQKVGNLEIYNDLKILDHEGALKLNINDTQRVLRAYEVVKTTGKPIKYWQDLSCDNALLKNYKYSITVIIPEREILYNNCNNRFHSMLENGAIQEVRALRACNHISPQVLNAIGVRQILSYIEHRISFEEMVEDAKTKTRQYAKRQVTWFKRYNSSRI